MNLKSPLVLAVLTAAANMVTAQEVPAPRHISEKVLATNKPKEDGSNASWPALAYSNVAWRKRVWRDIGVMDKANWVFRQEKSDQSLLNTLVAGVLDGKIKAYRDDQFSQELSDIELAMRMKMISSDSSEMRGRLISKYRVKEDSIGLRSEDRIEVRIVGIAAMVEQTNANGEKVDMPMLWVYYIDALNYLAQSPAPGKGGFTWADILESRSFTSTVARENNKMINSQPADVSTKQGD